MEVDGACLFFWNGAADLVASFWLADVTGVRDGDNGKVMPVVTSEEMTAALSASL